VDSPYGSLSGEGGRIDRAQPGWRLEADVPHAPDLTFDLWAEPGLRNDDDRAGVGFWMRW